MNLRTWSGLVAASVLMPIGLHAQRWSHTYDVSLFANGTSSVVLTSDSGFVFCNTVNIGVAGHGFRFTAVNSVGTPFIEQDHQLDTLYGYSGGASHSFVSIPEKGYLLGVNYFPSSDANGMLVRYSQLGDTLWSRSLPTDTSWKNIACIEVLSDSGFALIGSYRPAQKYDVYLVRTDTVGNVLWSRTYGGNEDQVGISGQRTLDGGFVIAGYNYYNNANSDLYVVKVDSVGDQQWAASYGSPWLDNVGFITQLPDSGYILAGGQRIFDTSLIRPVFYRLDAQGGVLWSEVYAIGGWGVFYAKPIVTATGFTASGGRRAGNGVIIGMLKHVDMAGAEVWERTYQTNSQLDHYFYDVKRTLDGGYIMAGTAFDSLLVSQDAWLVKVDSFGCLVPGCQVLDGLAEQFTDLGAVLTLYPNPVAAGTALQVGIELPPGFATAGALSLGLVSSDGRLVREQVVQNNATRAEVPTVGLAPGLYFLHLRDGMRWLSGGKVVVE